MKRLIVALLSLSLAFPVYAAKKGSREKSTSSKKTVQVKSYKN